MINSGRFLKGSEQISRGAKVLFRTMRPRHDDLALPEIKHTVEGYEYNVYYPVGKAVRTVIVIYGMTIAGKDDVRLMKFARSCVWCWSQGDRTTSARFNGL